MALIMRFGKYYENSPEQILLSDYGYFALMLDAGRIFSPLTLEKFMFLEYVVNNFKSKELCCSEGCENPAKYISIMHQKVHIDVTKGGRRIKRDYVHRYNDGKFVYCSPEHFPASGVEPELVKAKLLPLGFRSALFKSGNQPKKDAKNLVERMLFSMGMPKRVKRTKEYLEDFFNNVECLEPYRANANGQSNTGKVNIYRLAPS